MTYEYLLWLSLFAYAALIAISQLKREKKFTEGYAVVAVGSSNLTHKCSTLSILKIAATKNGLPTFCFTKSSPTGEKFVWA